MLILFKKEKERASIKNSSLWNGPSNNCAKIKLEFDIITEKTNTKIILKIFDKFSLTMFLLIANKIKGINGIARTTLTMSEFKPKNIMRK